jgi:site-specific recombinase XerD
MKKTNYYEICNQKLKYLNYSDKTIKSYLFYINQFLELLDIPPSRIKSSDFQSYLDNYQFTSVSQQNQVINAIRFLYTHGLNKKYDKVSFKRPKSEKKLPRVIDGEFTNLLESGTDIRIIQKIAGHTSSKTTEIYTHVSNQLLSKIKLPI